MADITQKSINESELETLRAENERLKRLAYHKEGITYQGMFTAVLGMADDSEKLSALEAIAYQMAEALLPLIDYQPSIHDKEKALSALQSYNEWRKG